MTNTPSAATGANVRAEMARRGVSQGSLAEQVGLSQPSLSKRLSGVVAFDINELVAIADALETPLDALMAGVGSAA